MATDRDQWADNLSGDSGGWLTGFLAEEDEFDRRSLWRLGSWGVGSVAAVIVALLANHFSLASRKEQIASADLVRQSQQIQWVAKESQNETRRLASAIDTLNSDRDRLYSRVTVLEQGLDSVTGSIGRQSDAAASAPSPSTATASAGPSTAATPSAPQPAADPPTASQIGPPAPAASPSTVSQTSPLPAAATPATTTAAAPDKATTEKPSTEKTSPEKTSPEKANTEKASTDKPNAVAALQPDPAANSSAPSPSAPGPTVARPEPTNNASAAAIAAPGATPTAPLMPAKSFMAPPDPAAARLTAPEPPTNTNGTLPPLPAPQTIAAAPPVTEPDAAEIQAPAIAVQRTEFGVDLGGANSIDGLRALWRGLLKYRSNKALAELRPIIVVKERNNGLGMQLRLVAGPISDAAAAARICATLTENDRSCEPSVFDGQRLAIKGDTSTPAPAAISNGHPAAAPTRPPRKRSIPKGAAQTEEPEKPPPPKSSLTSFLGLK
jgi:hypothetical protein